MIAIGRAVAVVVVLGFPAVASAAGTVSGTVTQVSNGAPIQGAVVTAAGPDQHPISATTGGGGSFSIDVGGNGPYSVGVQAKGFGGQAQGGVQPGAPLSFALTPAIFTPLPVDAGNVQSIVADPRSGIFYMLSIGASEIYRTDDYGGSWKALTMSYDDPGDGVRGTNLRNLMTGSSVSGEVAVFTEGGFPTRTASYSTDYGLTWRTIPFDVLPQGFQGAPSDPVMFWGHASPGAADNVLLLAQASDGASGAWDVWRADMSVPSPTFVKEPSDPFGPGSVVDVADSAAGSFVARYTDSGALSFAPLTATGPIGFGPDQATGLPTPPQILRLGGTKEASAPPGGALAVGGSGPYAARMLTKAAGADSFAGGSFSATTNLPDCQIIGRNSGGSVAPTSGGTAGAGTAGQCWIQKSGTDPLTVNQASSGRDLAYDARWGQGNHVSFAQGFGHGPLKFGRLNPGGIPQQEPIEKRADAGDAPESGGLSLNGLFTAAVNDTAYGPAGSSQQAAALSEVPVASSDGGQTMVEILPRVSKPSDAVEWWRGASGDWLVFGHGAICPDPSDTPRLSALLNWNGERLAAPNVGGSRCADLDGNRVFSLEAVPGTDTVFIGTGDFAPAEEKGVYRARLVPGSPSPSLADVVKLDAPLTNKPAAMAYCPPTSAREDMRDVLWVAAGEPYAHALLVPSRLIRVTGATGPSPAATVVDSIPHESQNSNMADVRANCSAGVVYAGGRADSAAPAAPAADATPLYKSVDGGQTFTGVQVPQPGSEGQPGTDRMTELTAIGLNPADPNDLQVAAEPTGATVHSTDGGMSWTVVNDPATQRAMRVNDVEFPTAASGGGLRRVEAASFLRAAQAPALDALVGTASGLFLGEVTATSGLIGQLGAPDAVGRLAARITTLASDTHPALAVPSTAPATGPATTVFHRSTGLHHASATAGRWSSPDPVPGTTSADDFPATALDGARRLRLAFARGSGKAGVYAATRDAGGAWSAPKRLSSAKGDTLPAIALAGKRIHVTFLRTKGAARARGVYHAIGTVSGASIKWTRPARVAGTGAADANAKLGGPALDARGKRVHLVFARAGRAPGIQHASTTGSKWSALRRLTRQRGDAEPALALDSRGVPQVVLRRTTGRTRALFALAAVRKPGLRRVAGTVAGDREPALTASGATLVLAFVRPAGSEPGVYFDRRSKSGKWLPKPLRWSGDARDRGPAVRADATGALTVVFERR